MANVDAKAQIETYWDKHGIPQVSLHTFMWNIELSLKSNQKRGVICGISDAGMGKSQTIRQIARKFGRRVVDIRTSQFSLIGAGVPQKANDATGMFKIAVPDNFPKAGEKCIMLFDEVNQGQQHAISMFFQLLEDRCLFNYEIPDDCLIVALMNPSTAGYNVSKIETNPAINRRLKKFYILTTFPEWNKHAKTEEFHYERKRPCHPLVRKFLETTPTLLYDTKSRDGYKQFASPATWETVSEDLYNVEDMNKELPGSDQVALTDERVRDRLASSINPAVADQLVAYIRDNEVRISPEEVCKNYTQKSKLRARIMDLAKEPGGGVPDLCENVAMYLFSEKPKTEKIAPQLALFWSDLPDELAQGFFQQLGAVAKSGGSQDHTANINYMKELTTRLQREEAWEILNQRLSRAHDTYDRAVKGEKASKDPMAPKGRTAIS